jgi:uncharacterized protein VirK/YbjX
MAQTPASLLLNLASGRFSRLDGLDEFKNRFKLVFRSVLTLSASLRWLETFTRDPVLLEFLRRNPRLACKLHRPYLYKKLNTTGKLAILQAHYQLEPARFPEKTLAALLDGQHLLLAAIQGKDESRYQFTLTHQHAFDKEGELSFQMRNQENIALVTLTFSLCNSPQGRTLLIGGIQGPNLNDDGSNPIKVATKACHGLFPKRVAMEALTVLARMLGMQSVQAVGKQQHIYNSWRYRRRFEADYDSFWQTLEAHLNPQGFFEVPLQLPRKTMEEIASKKRAEYQRRYNLMDELNAQIASSLLST